MAKEKQFNPAQNNEQSPAKGMASVNTHNPEEEPNTPAKTKERTEQFVPGRTTEQQNEGNESS